MGDIFAGRYELVDPLGEGGSGVVWRVFDHQRHVYCAAKVLRQTDASSLLRFMREQSLRLDHPHVLAPTGWAGTDDKVLFTMPIVSGGSVATLVSDFGPLPQALTALLLDQLLQALEAVHHEGVVHRDVTPANLLLDATGTDRPHLWLGDFGLASGEDAPRLTQGPYTMGTPGYTAPECLYSGWQPDAGADLYAAGMCAVEMLTGVRPDPSRPVTSALEQASTQQPVSRELRVVVETLAHPDPARRFSSAARARRALAELVPAHDVPAAQIIGDMEVFDHLPPLPQGWHDDGPQHPASALEVPTAATSDLNTDPEPDTSSRAGAGGLVLAGVGLVLIGVALLIYLTS